MQIAEQEHHFCPFPALYSSFLLAEVKERCTNTDAWKAQPEKQRMTQGTVWQAQSSESPLLSHLMAGILSRKVNSCNVEHFYSCWMTTG